jgi:hypothetical protein
MWLPRFISVFLSIGHLTFYIANAHLQKTVSGSSVWLPYKVQDDFLQGVNDFCRQAETSHPEEHSPPRVRSSNSRLLSCLSSASSSTPVTESRGAPGAIFLPCLTGSKLTAHA